MAFDLNSLVRPNILKLKPYSSARSEFAGEAEVFLDANENAFGSPAGDSYNRYPDPLQKELKYLIGEMNSVSTEQIFVGNGSDEAIDLLFRIFCEPGRDEAIICPPTYGMYRVSADINDVAIREDSADAEFRARCRCDACGSNRQDQTLIHLLAEQPDRKPDGSRVGRKTSDGIPRDRCHR
jgi:histidinol-phosphate aminotransferase